MRNNMKKVIAILAIALLLLVAACGKEDKEENANKEVKPEEVTMDKDEVVDNNKVVVRINDKDITGDLYNAVYLQGKLRAVQFGQDISEKEKMKELALNEIIAQELIKQDANKQGITVSEEDIQKEYDDLKSEDEKKFKEYLKQYKLTEKIVKEQILFTHILNQYVDKEIQIDEVTEEDAKEAYDKLKKEMDDIPKYEDAESTIKANLKQQREADALQVKVEELKETATIEKHI
ncbi:MAG TPA: hypothetical protein DCO80_12300 [Ornithinibacillus sp.]|nr:hypothetical protein [Ornithinibacillus sp.]